MKGILVLGAVVLLLVLMGVLFYYEDTHIVIQSYVQSITLINKLPESFIVKINLVVKNNGFLPMGLTITSVLSVSNGTSFSSLLKQPSKTYVNTTSINLSPFSKKIITVSYNLSPDFIIRYFYIEASGYYNFRYINTSMQLMEEINTLVQHVTSLQFAPQPYLISENLTLVSNPKPPYLYIVQPYNITLFSNNSYKMSFYVIFYPLNFKINNGSYELRVFVNNVSVYNTTILIPYRYDELLVPIGGTPIISQNSSYKETVYILFSGASATYYVEFELALNKS